LTKKTEKSGLSACGTVWVWWHNG